MLASILSSSSSREYSCSFIWGLFLCLPILAAYFLLGRSVRFWCIPKSNAACHWPWAPCLELSVSHSVWFPLLGWGVCRKNQTVCQDLLLPAPGPGVGQLQPQNSKQSTSAYGLSVGLKSVCLRAVLLSSRAVAPHCGEQ